MNTPPTVVLVHGAFADGSGWAAVADRLLRADVPVLVPVNPLRGLSTDGESIAHVVRGLDGPSVLVGHDYGGIVITHAGTQIRDVRGLVFIASFTVDRGQSVCEAFGSAASMSLASATVLQQGRAGELSVQTERFGPLYAADLTAARQAVLAFSQRPTVPAAFLEPLAVEPAWRRHPCWSLVTTRDRVVPPDTQRAAARRMNATVTEVAASHAVPLSQPDTVTVFILKALAALAASA